MMEEYVYFMKTAINLENIEKMAMLNDEKVAITLKNGTNMEFVYNGCNLGKAKEEFEQNEEKWIEFLGRN